MAHCGRVQRPVTAQWPHRFTISMQIAALSFIMEYARYYIGNHFRASPLLLALSIIMAIVAVTALGYTIHVEAARALVRCRPNASLTASCGMVFALAATLSNHVWEAPRDAASFNQTVPGDSIPADCRIVDGHSTVHETIIKGEPEPRPVFPGDEVYAGCSNGPGKMIVKVCKAGKEIWLARTLQAIAQGNEAKSDPEMFSNRILRWFSAAVLCCSAATGLSHYFTGASAILVLNKVVSVLLCAYPYTLGLGIPTCLMSANANAHAAGIFLRTSPQVERAADAKVIVFDKTGTLTSSTLHAKAIDTAVEWKNPGSGLTGKFIFKGSEFEVAIGNVRHMHAQPDSCLGLSTTTSDSMVYISINHRLAGCMKCASDTIPDASQVVDSLHGRGFQVFMMTGDTMAAALAVANHVGIPPTRVYADLAPPDKVKLINRLQARHGPVIMVGNNINDAPALSTAAFGVVVSHSPTLNNNYDKHGQNLVATLQEEADALLLPNGNSRKSQADKLPHSTSSPHRSNLQQLDYLIALTHETTRRVRHTLNWSLLYNLLTLPLASGLLVAVAPSSISAYINLRPWAASVLMSWTPDPVF
ncbi:HAD-like domain-containing protein [Bipolaris maydis]|nr:HAD-like domain-containing protein [Bipolaris maydis]